jgi:beta-lactamase superfamily II metal-dependent hydrolase
MNKTKTTIFTVIVFNLILCFVPSCYCQTAENVTVHFIDVGQGDCIFIDTSGQDVLIDAGSKSATQTVLNYLTNLNITHIHLIIATHAHEDHIGGLVGVLNSNITIDTVIYNNQTHSSATYTNFVTAAQTHNLTAAQRGQIFSLTKTSTLTVVNPVQPLQFSDQNDNSVVTKLQTGNTTFLFTGDAEEPAEQSMLVSSVVSLCCDVLKVGHHGSYTATTQTFLDIVDPKYAIISAGLDNKYDHPHNQTLQKLQTKNVTTYCTLQTGTIIAQTNGTTITFPNNPTPITIPEIPQNLIVPVFVSALTIIMLYKHKTTKTTNKR